MGKIIVCKNDVNSILFGNLQVFPEDGINKMSLEDARWFFQDAARTNLSKYGLHKEIPRDRFKREEIIGGAWGLVFNNMFLVSGKSGAFGPINENVVQKCIGESLQVIRV